MSLQAYGWTSFFAQQLPLSSSAQSGNTIGRVALATRGTYHLYTETGQVEAVLAGRLRHLANGSDDLPAVGDWVVLSPRRGPSEIVRIHAVLPRRTKISRKVAGAVTNEQVVAANVDVIFLVMGLDGDYNLRRLERLLVMAWESGGRPVVLLNKADLCGDAGARLQEVELSAPGVPVITVSCVDGIGLDDVRREIRPGETVALLGSSGVGKSTLINDLLGQDLMKTGAVRERDDRGRHTTTYRQLILLPTGGLVIDNPGLREIQLWSAAGANEGLQQTFEDLDELASQCRFRDCTHHGEPGCAVEEALRCGSLTNERLESFRGLERELRYLEMRRDERARRAEQRKLGRFYRTIQSEKRRTRGRS